jgi:hypothetical protein
MTLQFEKFPDLLARVRRGDAPPVGAVVELIRASYPELFRQVISPLNKGQETITIEPGDHVLVEADACVMHRDKLIRRRIVRRDEEGHHHEPKDDKGGEASDVVEYWKEIDAPKNGIVSIDWDRPYYGQSAAPEQRSGRILLTYFEPLGSASKEVVLKQQTDGTRRELAEAFATRCIPLALNAFLGLRVFLLSQDSLLLTRADLHGTERLQELARNPVAQDSDHLLAQYPEKNREAFQFFKALREEALASDERRAERSIEELPRALALEILTAIAIPQIHGTISSLLRMQYAFVQPNRVVCASLLCAGAALQPAWDIAFQLRLLDGMARAGKVA